MSFRFYSDAVSRASRSIAAGIFIVGLLLIGFGIIIIVLPEIFALIAAAVFFVAGLGCGVTALKIFLASGKLGKTSGDESTAYRKNVQIHTEEHHD